MSPMINAAASAVSRPRIKGRKLRDQEAERGMCRGAHMDAAKLALSAAAGGDCRGGDPRRSRVLGSGDYVALAGHRFREALSMRSGPARGLGFTSFGEDNCGRAITRGDLTARLDADPAPASNRSHSRSPEDDNDREKTRREAGRPATRSASRYCGPHAVRPPCATHSQPGRLFRGDLESRAPLQLRGRLMHFGADERSSY